MASLTRYSALGFGMANLTIFPVDVLQNVGQVVGETSLISGLMDILAIYNNEGNMRDKAKIPRESYLDLNECEMNHSRRRVV